MTTTENNTELTANDHLPSVSSEAKPIEKSKLAKCTNFLSPTTKGVLIGAVAGRFLPVLNTFTGAIVGGIAAKVFCQRNK